LRSGLGCEVHGSSGRSGEARTPQRRVFRLAPSLAPTWFFPSPLPGAKRAVKFKINPGIAKQSQPGLQSQLILLGDADYSAECHGLAEEPRVLHTSSPGCQRVGYEGSRASPSRMSPPLLWPPVLPDGSHP